LIVLKNDESTGFSHVATGDESWLSYRHESPQLGKITQGSPAEDKDNHCNTKSDGHYIFTETELLVLGVLSREEKFNQDHFLAAIAPGLWKENSNSKHGVDKTN
jgi:hypothetical protein